MPDLTRRAVLQQASMAALAAAAGQTSMPITPADAFKSGRPPKSDRHFESAAVERTIAEITRSVPNPKLAWMFSNCFPNTLDTTVFPGGTEAHPDTFIITGDIDAMWLRDSSAQVMPYVALAREDAPLRQLLAGVIRRQTRSILLDPYANAFMRSSSAPPLSWAVHDVTDMRPGVGERKWELDSLCFPIRLAYAFWKATGETAPFDAEWRQAMKLVVETMREQQRRDGPGPYRFERETRIATDTLSLSGRGNLGRPNGMIFSAFRPSDDACTFPLSVPDNLFAVVSLRQLADLFQHTGGNAPHTGADAQLATEALALAAEVASATQQNGRMRHPVAGEIWAFEVDGFGGQACMDDAGAPGLLSLPYLGCCTTDDALYQRTRSFVLSSENPWFVRGSAGEGISSPHTGTETIWPMGILYQALTSTGDAEILHCLQMLMNTQAGTGFIHESFNKDNANVFTRPWFAWCNSLFGELILKLSRDRPSVLQAV